MPRTLFLAEAHDLRGALGAGVSQLEAAGAPSAGFSAELLLLHVLGHDRAWLYAHPEDRLTAEEQSSYARLLERRAAGTPTQYLTGRQEFWGMDFEVTPAVFIPRPETEHLIEVALARLDRRRTEPLWVADVGTGSGCLAVALARELPRAHFVATDISAAALEVARRNAARHGVPSRIEFLQMDLLASYIPAHGESAPHFDLIISNPPYIGRRESAQLPPEVREHEPPEALFSGQQGLKTYPPLVAQAEALLRDRGVLGVELGYGFADLVRRLLESEAWSDVSITPDLAGIERVLSAERASRHST